MDTRDIDRFLADSPKTLVGMPDWVESDRPDELSATWNIADSAGIISAQLRFRCPAFDKLHPSVSLIFRGTPVWRVDLARPTLCKWNLPDAADLGLPAQVCGSHEHAWPDNRQYVIDNGGGQLPYRRPLPPQVRRLPQATLVLADQINLEVGHDQRGFDVPPYADLFERQQQ
ncbi:hypothetical protein [Methyloligella halotolerans]|uniref:hypothetical protein n=1 Tax=Methyloligella halotolerans TaxID=1177755 RepID=UPI00114D17B9|nr:hypothetical protein [Methyloligella halotolerans]